ncbi:MAG: LysR family transcriptional regulator [Kineosporiaceae bacterium]
MVSVDGIGTETGGSGRPAGEQVSWARALCPMLEVLCAVGEGEHLTQAARALGVPQPTVSRTIARIERRLGLAVVERQGRRVRLTPAGQALVDGARVACGEVERAGRAARDLLDPGSGLVRLASLATLPPMVVPQLVAAWRGEHPRVRVALAQDVPQALLDRLDRGEVDIAITSPLPVARGRLLVAPLVRQPLRLLVPSGHRLSGRGRVGLREASEEPFVLPVPGLGLAAEVRELCERHDFVPVVGFEAVDLATVRGLVAAGLGVAIVPGSPPGAAPRDGTVEVKLDGDPSRSVGLVWRVSGDESPAHRRFREFALEVVPRLFAGPVGGG